MKKAARISGAVTVSIVAAIYIFIFQTYLISTQPDQFLLGYTRAFVFKVGTFQQISFFSEGTN